MIRPVTYKLLGFALLVFLLFASNSSSAQIVGPEVMDDTIPPMPSYAERSKKWGPNDTIMTDAIW